MELTALFLVGFVGLWLLIKLARLFGQKAAFLTSILDVVVKTAWLSLVAVTAVALLFFWHSDLQPDGLSLTLALTGLVFVVWLRGKQRLWQ